MQLFIVLELEPGGELVQAHGRNKSYKTLDTAIEYGLLVLGGQNAEQIYRDEDSAVFKGGFRSPEKLYLVVDLTADLAKKVNDLLALISARPTAGTESRSNE